jgi:metal-responsive CopG/Arc/MetJ family transcriptional regulator
MKKEKWVVFREEKQIVDLIDSFADNNGIGRSGFIRQAIRKQLAESNSLINRNVEQYSGVCK